MADTMFDGDAFSVFESAESTAKAHDTKPATSTEGRGVKRDIDNDAGSR